MILKVTKVSSLQGREFLNKINFVLCQYIPRLSTPAKILKIKLNQRITVHPLQILLREAVQSLLVAQVSQLEKPLTVATQCSEFFTFSTLGLTFPEYFALKKKMKCSFQFSRRNILILDQQCIQHYDKEIANLVL